jgi:hypothetical protein
LLLGPQGMAGHGELSDLRGVHTSAIEDAIGPLQFSRSRSVDRSGETGSSGTISADSLRRSVEDRRRAMTETMTLWRPTGPQELELVRASGWRAWPPRLPDQPIFYPVLNEQYAIMIARDWNVPTHGVGYVTRFDVDREFAQRYPTRQVGGRDILELWVPAEELDEFNQNIVGQIEVVHEFRHDQASAT